MYTVSHDDSRLEKCQFIYTATFLAENVYLKKWVNFDKTKFATLHGKCKNTITFSQNN